MNSATAFRWLILVVPLAWVIIRLLPAEHPQYGNLRAIASQERQAQQETAGRYKETSDKFASHESSFRAHYQSHFA
ncbi:MAG: hypothetical protein OEV51_05680, partial [Nitrospira sp.]|nr:hypothetical protein [Nitrospira sp.]